MISLSDLLNGPKMFEETFGLQWGRRFWLAFFTVAVLAIAAVCLTEIGGFGRDLLSAVSGWFSPSSTAPGPTALQPPGKAQKCVITGGTNNGTQIQNCSD
jgi:hypothetical protein